MPGRSELLDGVVIRLAVRSDIDFIPDRLAADAGDFALSTQERQRVISGDGVGSISVWDSQRTTPEQADAFLEPKPRIAFRLSVALIRQLPFDLHVASDPLNDPRAGAAGHCTLEDVWRSDKHIRRQIQGRLALIAGDAIVVSRN